MDGFLAPGSSKKRLAINRKKPHLLKIKQPGQTTRWFALPTKTAKGYQKALAYVHALNESEGR